MALLLHSEMARIKSQDWRKSKHENVLFSVQAHGEKVSKFRWSFFGRTPQRLVSVALLENQNHDFTQAATRFSLGFRALLIAVVRQIPFLPSCLCHTFLLGEKKGK